MVDSIQLSYAVSGVNFFYFNASDLVLNNTTHLFETWNDSNYATYKVAATTVGTSMRWTASRPAQVTIPCKIVARIAVDGTPANDEVIGAAKDEFNFDASQNVLAASQSLPTTPPTGYGPGSVGAGAWPVTVLVTSDGSTPISGATVRLSSNTQNLFATTGLDGLLGFSVDPGTFTISIVAAGYHFAPIVDTVNGSGKWGANGTTAKTVTMVQMTPSAVAPNPYARLTLSQLTIVFKNLGKLIYAARLAHNNSQLFRQHMLNLNRQVSQNEDPTDGGLSYDVMFNYDMRLQEMAGGLIAQDDAGVIMAKTAMDTYLTQIGSLVGAKDTDTPNRIANLLAGNVAAATGYVQPSGGLDPFYSFAAYFGQNYSTILPQNIAATFLDAWITTTIV